MPQRAVSSSIRTSATVRPGPAEVLTQDPPPTLIATWSKSLFLPLVMSQKTGTPGGGSPRRRRVVASHACLALG
jgi:hypothetical protein